jgi:hypothetical protein
MKEGKKNDVNHASEALATVLSGPQTLSYQYLHALPNSGYGQKMDAHEFRVILMMRLLIPFFPNSYLCPHEGCTHILDPFGYHFLSCGQKGNLMHQRHEIVARGLYDLARAAGFSPQLNAPVQCLGFNEYGDTTKYRPADVLIMGDEQPLACVDVTVVSPLTKAKSTTAEGRQPGKLVTNAAASKHKKYDELCTKHGKQFIPFACDVTGMIDSEACQLIKRIATKYADRQGKPYSWGLSICQGRISFAIQHAISRQLLSLLQLAEECWGDSKIIGRHCFATQAKQ